MDHRETERVGDERAEDEQHAFAFIFADVLHRRVIIFLWSDESILVTKLDDVPDRFVQLNAIGSHLTFSLIPFQ